jgi:transcriptional regulator NrdR family protein
LAEQRTHIVKRSPNYTEPYDERKLYASVYAACLCVRTPAGEAELTAERVCLEVAPWVASKTEITSKDIRHKAANALQIYNPDAAYMYERHRIIA